MSTGAGTASGLEKHPFPAKEGAVSDSEAGGGTQRGDVARGRVDHFGSTVEENKAFANFSLFSSKRVWFA